MSRLPIPGQDDGNWGSILNDYLSQSLDSAGNLKNAALTSANAELTTNKGQPNGYAPLNSSALVPPANLGTGTASSTTVLTGDNTWQPISGITNGVGDYLGLIGNAGATVSSAFADYSFSGTTASNGTSVSWSSSTPQTITANATGVYAITITAYWFDRSTSGGFNIQIFTSCAFRFEDVRPAFTDGATASTQHIAATVYLQQGQTITVAMSQSTNNATLAPAVWALVTRVA